MGTALIILFAVVAPASYFLILFRLRHRLEVRCTIHCPAAADISCLEPSCPDHDRASPAQRPLVNRMLSRLPGWLQEDVVKRKFGFLYSGYSLHYWETAEMIRKLALATIPVFIKTQPTGSLQVCCLLPFPAVHLSVSVMLLLLQLRQHAHKKMCKPALVLTAVRFGSLHSKHAHAWCRLCWER